MLKNHFPFAFLLFLFALAACEDEPGCVTNDTNVVEINFYQIDDTTQRNATSVVIPGVEAVGVGPYTLDTGDVVSARNNYLLILNPEEDATTFYVFQENGTVDTIVLRYQREQRVISPDCGPTQRYFDLSVDTAITTFDSVRVVEPELGTLSGTNIEIYTCQDTFYTEEVVFNFQEKPDTLAARTDSLFVQAIRNEAGQTLVENDTIVGNLRLPINPLAESTTFTFELLAHDGEPARAETLTVSYEQEATRLAKQCALQTRYFGLDTLRSTFDSLRIENRELAVDVPLNIRIVDFVD